MRIHLKRMQIVEHLIELCEVKCGAHLHAIREHTCGAQYECKFKVGRTGTPLSVYASVFGVLQVLWDAYHYSHLRWHCAATSTDERAGAYDGHNCITFML